MSGLLDKLGRSRISKLPDGRKRIVDRFKVRSDAADPANLETLVFLAFGTAHPKYTDCVLVDQSPLDFSGPHNVEQDLVRVYEQLPAASDNPNEVQAGGDQVSLDSNNRHVLTRTSLQLAGATLVEGTIGSTISVGSLTYALTGVSHSSNGAVRSITRRYVEATATEVQVGRDSISRDSNNRRVVDRQFIQLASAAYVEGTIGSTITVSATAHALTSESKVEDEAVRTITRRYIEATATEVQVGKDEQGTDSNGRNTIRRTFVQLASAAYVAGTIGASITVDTVVYALASVSKGGDGAVRVINRAYVQASSTVTQVGPDEKGTDENGRSTITANFVQLASASYTAPDIGSAAVTGYVHSTEAVGGDTAVRAIRRTYVEVTGTLTEIGYPLYSRDDDDRKRISRTFVILPASAGAEPSTLSGSVGVEVFDGCVCSRAVVSDHSKARAIIRKDYIQATTTPAQIGDVTASSISGRVFTGTTGAGAVDGSTKLARSWTLQYIVKTNDTSDWNTAWLAINSTLTIGVTTAYLYSSQVVRKGIGFYVVARSYVELPDKLVYKRWIQYTFPGVLGYSSSLGPYVAVQAVTRETSVEIHETYHVGEVAADALEYEPTKWSQGNVTYTRATGEAGFRNYNFTGVLGGFSISMSNKVFDGALCSTVAGTIASTPTAVPTGKKLISSKPEPWLGNIWVKRNVYLTFPS